MWDRLDLNGHSLIGNNTIFMDTDLKTPFVLDGWLYFIPQLPYGSEARWEAPEPGVYRIKADADPVWMMNSEQPFPVECVAGGDVRSFTVSGDIIICAGEMEEGVGLYVTDPAVGTTRKIFEGNVYAPNTTSEYIWFRTDAEGASADKESPRYDYWRVKYDGSGLERLDYENKIWAETNK